MLQKVHYVGEKRLMLTFLSLLCQKKSKLHEIETKNIHFKQLKCEQVFGIDSKRISSEKDCVCIEDHINIQELVDELVWLLMRLSENDRQEDLNIL